MFYRGRSVIHLENKGENERGPGAVQRKRNGKGRGEKRGAVRVRRTEGCGRGCAFPLLGGALGDVAPCRVPTTTRPLCGRTATFSNHWKNILQSLEKWLRFSNHWKLFSNHWKNRALPVGGRIAQGRAPRPLPWKRGVPWRRSTRLEAASPGEAGGAVRRIRPSGRG